jgi:tetratricopeptide (TPR) repeat protein
MTEPPSPSSSLTNHASNHGAQGTFYGPVSFGAAPPVSQPSLEEARALLDWLPLDQVPLPQTLPTPHQMPLNPNPLFVGRENELRSIAAQLKIGGRVAITTGIGGVGKTQLAAEVAYRYGEFFAGGVFWVSCADPAGIASEVASCGQLMGLFPLSGVDQDAQVRLTRAAWDTPIPRLLIFDNCEDEQTLRRWLPRPSGCRVLVTSRRQSGWSPELRVLLLPLDVLSRAESVALLQQLAPRLTAEEAAQIAEALGDLPLALHLAGCYLARYRLSVVDYLAKLALQHPSLQGHGLQGLPTDREPHVERAFALSLVRLDASKLTDDLARKLLVRAACFAPGEPFQRAWLEAMIEPEGDDEEQMRARTDAVERLLELGLLEAVGEEALRLHRLLVAYVTLTLHDDAALSAVEEIIGDEADRANNTRHPAAMQPVLVHLRYLVQGAAGREDEQAAWLLNELGNYLLTAGRYAEAQPLFEQALAIHERVLGNDHPQTATSLNNLAILLKAQGAYDRALPLFDAGVGNLGVGVGKRPPADRHKPEQPGQSVPGAGGLQAGLAVVQAGAGYSRAGAGK